MILFSFSRQNLLGDRILQFVRKSQYSIYSTKLNIIELTSYCFCRNGFHAELVRSRRNTFSVRCLRLHRCRNWPCWCGVETNISFLFTWEKSEMKLESYVSAFLWRYTTNLDAIAGIGDCRPKQTILCDQRCKRLCNHLYTDAIQDRRRWTCRLLSIASATSS